MKHQHVLVLVLIALLVLSCSKQDSGSIDSSPQTFLKMRISGGDEVFVAPDEFSGAHLAAVNYGPGHSRQMNKRLNIFVQNAEIDIGKTVSFAITTTATSTGRFTDQDFTVDYFSDAIRVLGYSSFKSDKSTDSFLTITRYDIAPGGVIAGSFKTSVCYNKSISANTCDIASNTLTLEGDFQVGMRPGYQEYFEGTRETPREMDSDTFSHVILVLDKKDGYYTVKFPVGGKYEIGFDRAYLYENKIPLMLALFHDKSFAEPFCVVSGAENKPCAIETGLESSDVYVKVSSSNHDLAMSYRVNLRATDSESEGTEEEPKQLPSMLPLDYAASVGADSDSFYRMTVPVNEIVTVRLVHEDAPFLIARVSDISSQEVCSPSREKDTYQRQSVSSCVIKSESGSIAIQVHANPYQGGQRFKLAVSSGGLFYENEGSREAPRQISDPAPVVFDGKTHSASYYAWQGKPDTVYRFSIIGDDVEDLNFEVSEGLSEIGNGFFRNSICQFQGRRSRYQRTHCAAISKTGVFFINASGNAGASAQYTLQIEEGGIYYPNETKILKNVVPFVVEGSVGTNESSYALSVNAGQTYTVSLRNKTTEAIRFFSRSNDYGAGGLLSFKGVTSCSDRFITVNESTCSFTADSDSATVYVSSDEFSQGGKYELSVTEGGLVYSSEGTNDAVVLGDSPVVHEGSVGVVESVYRFVTKPNAMYQVMLLPHDQAATMSINNEKDDTLCYWDRDGMSQHICDINASASGDILEIRVARGQYSSGTQFTLSIDEIQ